MPLAIDQGEIRLLNLKTRIPFRYGIATMTQMPQAMLHLRVTIDGKSSPGFACDLLPPKWFTKDPARDPVAEIKDMIRVIQAALAHAAGLQAPNPFALWLELTARQRRWGEQNHLAPLLAQFGVSLVERALIDAFCRSRQSPFHKLLNKNFLGIDLGKIHPELEGSVPADFLRVEPLSTVICRHTVGLDDPIAEDDIPRSKRLKDGLPQSLEAALAAYRLRHLKIKFQGKFEADATRLERIAALFSPSMLADAAFSLDGNEQFDSARSFKEFWIKLRSRPGTAPILDRLLFVEQPIHRDRALAPDVAETLEAWPGRPPLIIDESDADFDSLRVALALGYDGTSHKNCKGVFKGIANRCLLREHQRQRQRAAAGRAPLMSGEDLCNIGPVSLNQDLALMAVLGIESVERNGHHYCAGLSLLPEPIQKAALELHPDLYRITPARWPALRIEQGALRLDSVNSAPFGIAFLPDVRGYQPLAQWTPPIADKDKAA